MWALTAVTAPSVHHCIWLVWTCPAVILLQASLISCLIHSLTHGLFRNINSFSNIWGFLTYLSTMNFLLLITQLIYIFFPQRANLYDLNILKHIETYLLPRTWSILVNVPCASGKMPHCAVLVWSVFIRLSGLIMLSRSSLSVLIFCLLLYQLEIGTYILLCTSSHTEISESTWILIIIIQHPGFILASSFSIFPYL